MRYFETPKMNISMFDEVVSTKGTGAAIPEASTLQPVTSPIAALDPENGDALVGRTSFNALMQVQK